MSDILKIIIIIIDLFKIYYLLYILLYHSIMINTKFKNDILYFCKAIFLSIYLYYNSETIRLIFDLNMHKHSKKKCIINFQIFFY